MPMYNDKNYEIKSSPKEISANRKAPKKEIKLDNYLAAFTSTSTILMNKFSFLSKV